MGMGKEVDIKEAAKALVFAAGLAAHVAQVDIQRAAYDIAKKYGETRSREIEADIARHIRNQG